MIGIIEKALLAALAANSGITTVVSTRIYSGQPPIVAAIPYVLVTHNSGGSTNSSPRDDVDMTFSIKCVGQDTNGVSGAATARGVADAIRTALHKATLTLDAPWAGYTCNHLDDFAFAENADRTTYFHAGGMYRVRAAVQ